jgi:outer membrane lipoprotein-sorting protein
MLKSPIFRLLAMSSALTLSLESAVASDAFDIEALVRGFAAMPGLSARFREEKQISLLQVPLVSEGVLYFAPPDRIARHVERPAPSTLIVHNDELVIGTPGERHTFDLAAQPVLRPFVDAFRLVLAGDLERLRELYAIESRANDSQRDWRIQLLPRDERLAGMIRSIEIAGHDAILLELRVVEADGDSTVTRFTDVDRSRRFSDPELDALFRIPP